ncbi:MAG: TfoX/Sxy family protein [Actinomycetota bacterium]
MQMPKASEEAKERFRALVSLGPEVEVKPMFGNLAAFVHGNMFAGLLGSSLGVRLPEDELDALAEVDGAHPFGPEDRPMRHYLSVPDGWADDPDVARPWVERALAHVSQLPPKPPKRAPSRR